MTTSGEWTRVDNRHWVSKRGGALFERQLRDSMAFVLYLSQHTQVWMEFPRLYPHEPPAITRVVHPNIHHAMCTVEPATSSFTAIQSDNTTVVYDQWSPVRRLDDLLAYLIDALTRHSHRGLGTPTLLLDEDMDVEESTTKPVLNLQQELSPNRFDRGYPKTNWKNAHRTMKTGTMETDLMNSDSYNQATVRKF